MGRSRGGFGTKFRLATCGNSVPIQAVVSAGQAHESRHVERLLDGIRVGRRRRPRSVGCDKGYDLPRVRRVLWARGLCAVIPEKRKPHGRKRGHPPGFDRESYQRRSVVERRVGWPKQNRHVGTRYAKLAVNDLAFVRQKRLFEPASS